MIQMSWKRKDKSRKGSRLMQRLLGMRTSISFHTPQRRNWDQSHLLQDRRSVCVCVPVCVKRQRHAVPRRLLRLSSRRIDNHFACAGDDVRSMIQHLIWGATGRLTSNALETMWDVCESDEILRRQLNLQSVCPSHNKRRPLTRIWMRIKAIVKRYARTSNTRTPYWFHYEKCSKKSWNEQ